MLARSLGTEWEEIFLPADSAIGKEYSEKTIGKTSTTH